MSSTRPPVEVCSDGAEGIACWFLEPDYNQETFAVRHAYFLGADDTYKALRTRLKARSTLTPARRSIAIFRARTIR